ncbi:MAG: hypothetical protein D6818_08385, partial [Bacteroidetes bacterium]
PLAVLQTQLASPNPPFCGDLSTDFFNATIGLPPAPGFIDTTLCLNECIMVGNQEVCWSQTVDLPGASWLGCDSQVVVVIVPIPPSAADYPVTVCAGDCIDFNGQTYCPPGPHVVTLTNWQGCDSLVNITFTEVDPQAVVAADTVDLPCDGSGVPLDGSGSSGYTALTWYGPAGFTSTDSVVQATTAGTWTLVVENDSVSPPCTDTAFVQVMGGASTPDPSLPWLPELCAGQSIDLDTLTIVDANATGATYTWHSATPADSSNLLAGTLVTLDSTTTFYLLAVAGQCMTEVPVTITVWPVPTATFFAASPICLTDSTTVQYTGSASANATYIWNFDGGMAIPGTGPGPHQVFWADAGLHVITLVVEEHGCVSSVWSDTVQVDAPLPEPVVQCG